jgi:hypothetical protein
LTAFVPDPAFAAASHGHQSSGTSSHGLFPHTFLLLPCNKNLQKKKKKSTIQATAYILRNTSFLFSLHFIVTTANCITYFTF